MRLVVDDRSSMRGQATGIEPAVGSSEEQQGVLGQTTAGYRPIRGPSEAHRFCMPPLSSPVAGLTMPEQTHGLQGLLEPWRESRPVPGRRLVAIEQKSRRSPQTRERTEQCRVLETPGAPSGGRPGLGRCAVALFLGRFRDPSFTSLGSKQASEDFGSTV